MDVNQYTVTIKKGSLVFKVDRTDLVNIEHTSDGLVFNLKHQTYINITDQYMPLDVKQKVKSADAIPNGNVTFDLNNYRNPVSVQIKN